jgi:hypothetical protein
MRALLAELAEAQGLTARQRREMHDLLRIYRSVLH